MAEPDSNKQIKRSRPIGPFSLWGLSVIVGIVSGLGAAAFRGLIAFFHNLFFLGRLSIFYDANAHTPAGPWGPWIILAPVIGGLGVAFLVKTFAPEAKGHGVPEVMDAIYYNKGLIRPVVAFVKAMASALSIGSGGSVGREGPIIQIASAFGSTFGQWLRIPAWQRVTLIAAGAGGGIAATFNTPIGGILFAAEIMLHEVSVWTLVPVAISTATATYIGRLFFGANPSFVIPEFRESFYHATNPVVLLSYVGLAVLAGGAAALFIRSIYVFEDLFEKKIRGNYYVRHTLGMLLVGVMMYLMMRGWGHYYIQGIGYSTVQDILSGVLATAGPLALLFVLKLMATSLTLGSGGSGGIFSPSLYLGATLGATYGSVLGVLFPALPISPPAFAVAGMAGMVGGATSAAITSIVMIFEMTRDYGVIVPMTITVAISYGVRKVLLKESIYTLKLARRGHYMPDALQTNLQHMRLARDLKNENMTLLPAGVTLEELRKKMPEPGATPPLFVIERDGQIKGVLTEEMAYRAMRRRPETETVGDAANLNYDVIGENTTLFEIVTRMHTNRTDVFLVSGNLAVNSGSEIRGWISKERIAHSMAEGIGLFAE